MANKNRRVMGERLKREINEEFGHRCAYCGIKLGSVVSKQGRHKLLEPNYDHFVPFAHRQSRARMNWVLACCVCNNLKGSDLYETPGDVVSAIADRRVKYELIWDAPVAMTEDVNVWGVKYASWLVTPDYDYDEDEED